MANNVNFDIRKRIATDKYEADYHNLTNTQTRSSATYDVICTSGTATDLQALEIAEHSVRRTEPLDCFGNPIKRVSLASTVADGRAWTFDVEYSPKAGTQKESWDSFFDFCYVDQLDGACETSTVTRSLQQVPHLPVLSPLACVVPQNRFVNVVDGVAQGVPILTPTGKFSVRARIAYSQEKLIYARNLFGFQGKTNFYPFWDYPPGTVLFEGFHFNLSGVSDSGNFSAAYLDGRFNFQVRPDLPVNIDGAEFVKGGWEAVWALSCETDDQETGHRFRATVCVYAETVYDRFDFSVLRLTNINNNIN